VFSKSSYQSQYTRIYDFFVGTYFPRPKYFFFFPPELTIETFILEVLLRLLSLVPSLYHVLTGLRLLLFPCGLHSATCLVILQSSIRMTWPDRLNFFLLLPLIYPLSFPIFVLIVLFLIPSIRSGCKIK
jgi:hypothetical protein